MMVHVRFGKLLGHKAFWVVLCALWLAPAAAQNQSASAASAAKKRGSADITALLQAQAIADAAQRAAKAHEQAVLAAQAAANAAAKNAEPGTLPAAGPAPAALLPDPAQPRNPNALASAQHVHLGPLRCELGAIVHVEADANHPGLFHVHGNGFRYRMLPVPTSTGALRLEDKKAGAVWLQLANKSMLMDQNKGRRVADGCAHPDQVAFVQATQNQPPTDLFDTAGMGRPLD